jgi:hypothetical protein
VGACLAMLLVLACRLTRCWATKRGAGYTMLSLNKRFRTRTTTLQVHSVFKMIEAT